MATARIAGLTTGRAAISRTTHVIDDVSAGVLVTGDIRLDHIPAEEREGLIEARDTGEVGRQQVLEASVPQPHRDVREGNTGLFGLRKPIAVVVHERARIEVRLPLRCGEI